MAKSTESEASVINLIGNGTSITGDIQANGDMRIDGILNGSLKVKGKVVVGNTGQIDGEIVCQSADFSGIVKGNITVTDLLMIKSTAQVTGDLRIGKLAIEPGAHYSGNCVMQDSGARYTTPQAVNEEKVKEATS